MLQTCDMFVDGAFASVCAVIISNPFDVVRTRMQLQGQMRKAGEYEVLYTNLFQATCKMAKEEGLLSLQKGLVPAILWQVAQNGIRIGLYPLAKEETSRALDAAQSWWHSFLPVQQQGSGSQGGELSKEEEEFGEHGSEKTRVKWSESQAFLVSLVAGGGCGVAGATVASPFTLVKTRLQSDHGGTVRSARVLSEASTGTQFHYAGVLDALKSTYRRDGLAGLWQGAGIAAQRTMIASAVQLTSYDYTRRYWATGLGLSETDARIHVLAGISASFFTVLFANPFHVAMTRVYNSQRLHEQGPRGGGGGQAASKLSGNIFKQICSIYRVEGVRGMYKGSVAFFARSAPHGMVTFVVLEWVRKMRETYTPDRAYTKGLHPKVRSTGTLPSVDHRSVARS